jgi:hypothetical protein
MNGPQSDPVVHIPLYSADGADDDSVRYMVEMLLACLASYFAHENTYDVLVTTNDWRILQILIAYQAKTRYRFDMKLVSREELQRAFHTDESRLRDFTCMRTIFSKFYPIVTRQAGAILHVDCDTIFLAKVDLSPLFVSPIALVDANQFMQRSPLWWPTESQADFFGISKAMKPVAKWINSGVFAVQREGFAMCQREVWHYLENLERAWTDRLIHGNSDEVIMNALAVKEREAVTVIPDYRYHFVAYYGKYDPDWLERVKILHFHSLKPDTYSYCDGALKTRCEENHRDRLSADFYLASLIWFRYLHTACHALPYEFPTRDAMPLEFVEKELATKRYKKR